MHWALTTAAQVLLIVLLADFIGGLFHWAEDTFGHLDTPIWGPLFVRPNIGHHDRPADILQVPWLRGARMILLAGAVILGTAWVLGALSWQLILLLALAGLNDQAHRWEHTPPARLPRLVPVLRRLKVLQTARHHWQHHIAPHTSHYCVLTPWLNPVLDRSGFWRGMEALLSPLFGTPRQRDMAGRNG